MKSILNRYRLIIALLSLPLIASSADYYWIGGGGNWNDPAHWSSTSGGAPSAIVPGLSDNAIFDGNSFLLPGQVVTIGNESIGNLDFSNATNNPTITGNQIKVYASLILSPSMQWDPLLRLIFESLSWSGINTAGVQLGDVSIFGMVELNSDLHADTLIIQGYGFKTNDHQVNCNYVGIFDMFSDNYDLGSSEIYCSVWDLVFSSSGGTMFTGANASINITGPNGIFNNSNLPPNQLIYPIKYQSLQLTASATISGSVFLDSLILNNPGNAVDIAGSLFINDFIVTYSTNASPIQLTGSNGGFIYKDGFQVCLNDMIIQDLPTAGSADFFAGAGSIDLGNNAGWTFDNCGSSAKGYYWVNNSGNWNDVSHWATASGGSVFHTTPPTQNDNVYFDALSFTAPGHIVGINAPASCRNLSMNGVMHPFTLDTAGVGSQMMSVYGSVLFSDQLIPNLAIGFDLIGGAYKSITSSSAKVSGIHCNGTVYLNDDLNTTILWVKTGGTFYSNGFYITCEDSVGLGGRLIISGLADLHSSNISTNSFYAPDALSEIIMDNALFLLHPHGSHAPNDTITFYSEGNNSVGLIIANGDASFNVPIGKIRKLILTDSTLFLSDMSIDSLLLDMPGKSLRMETGTTTEINNHIALNGTPQSLVNITSTAGFVTISKVSGSICLHNASLQNIIAGGGAQFYADTSCLDLGGNTGWLFQPCEVISDVWPGDANYDLIVDNHDVLNIGLAMGETGPIRPAASLAYVAQPATDWSSFFQSAVNKKHADTDGNGIVDANDVAAVNLNYGLSHPARPAELPSVAAAIPFYVDIVQDSAAVGDTVQINFILGTPSQVVDSIYGIAFSVSFNTAIIDTNVVFFDYSNSWMGDSAITLLNFQKELFSNNRIDFAMTRINHTDTSGFGTIGTMGIVIVDNIGARMPFTISSAVVVNSNEIYLPIFSNGDTLFIDSVGVGIEQAINEVPFEIYPNPAVDKVFIFCSSCRSSKIEIYNTQGSLIWMHEGWNYSTSVPGNLFPGGVYMVRIISHEGSSVKRLILK